MAIRRQAATVEKSPEVVDVNQTVEVPAATSAPGPVAVPNAVQAAPDASAASPGDPSEDHKARLSWGLVVDGLPLMRHLVEIGREVNQAKGGYATLADLLEGVKASPIFTNNTHDGTTLADLVNPLNLRNQWVAFRDKFVIQFSAKPVDQGGLGLAIPPIDPKEAEKKWIGRCKKLFTTGQWAQMEDAIAKPKPHGLDFPKLVAGHRGRRSQGLNIEDI